jgi:hypothetical protein
MVGLSLQRSMQHKSGSFLIQQVNTVDRTISSDVSPSFFPMSLFDQSSVLSFELDMRPGTTRGMVVCVDGLVTFTSGISKV